MEIQQHDGVVVEVAGSRQGFAKRKRGGRGVTGGRGRRQGLDCCCPPSPPPTIYRAKGEGGAALALPPRKGAAREESILPKAPRRCLPPLGLSLFLISWRMGLLGLVPLAHVGQGAPPTAHVAPRGRWPHPVDPRDPSGGPGTIPVTPKLVPMPETGLPIYKSLPPDHSGTPRDVRDLIRDSEQHSVTTYKLPL